VESPSPVESESSESPESAPSASMYPIPPDDDDPRRVHRVFTASSSSSSSMSSPRVAHLPPASKTHENKLPPTFSSINTPDRYFTSTISLRFQPHFSVRLLTRTVRTVHVLHSQQKSAPDLDIHRRATGSSIGATLARHVVTRLRIRTPFLFETKTRTRCDDSDASLDSFHSRRRSRVGIRVRADTTLLTA